MNESGVDILHITTSNYRWPGPHLHTTWSVSAVGAIMVMNLVRGSLWLAWLVATPLCPAPGCLNEKEPMDNQIVYASAKKN